MTDQKNCPWIDDDEKNRLKSDADILALIREFGSREIKKSSGDGQYKSKCVFPDCEAKPHDYPLGINTRQNIFNCFHCGRKGDVLDLVMKFKGLDFYNAKKAKSAENAKSASTALKEDQIIDHITCSCR